MNQVFICDALAIEGGFILAARLSHATRICDLLLSSQHRELVTVPSLLLTDVWFSSGLFLGILVPDVGLFGRGWIVIDCCLWVLTLSSNVVVFCT